MKLFYRTNGFIVGFHKYNGELFLHFFIRILQFFFDIWLPNLIMILMYFVYKNNIFLSSFWSFICYVAMQMFAIFIFKNKTFGMVVSNLCITDKKGIIGNRTNMLYRIMFSSVYFLPFIGWLLLIPVAITTFITKGISPIDLITKTQVLPKYKALYFHKILTNLEGGI